MRFLFLLPLAGCLMAQSQPAKFDVASIKAAAGGRGMRTAPQRFEWSGATLGLMIRWAYQLEPPGQQPDRLQGPASLDEGRFDIVATMSAPTDANGVRTMLRTLLAERFKLVVRVEKREVPVYLLTVAPGGVKMKQADAIVQNPGGGSATHERLDASLPIAALVDRLRRETGRPVIDRTGLTGIYQFVLDWYRDAPARAVEAGANLPLEAGPDIYQAVEKQLGLKLTAGKEPTDFVIVDSAEKMPIEN